MARKAARHARRGRCDPRRRGRTHLHHLRRALAQACSAGGRYHGWLRVLFVAFSVVAGIANAVSKLVEGGIATSGATWLT